MCENGPYPRITHLTSAVICDVGPCTNDTRTRVNLGNDTAVDVCKSCRAKLTAAFNVGSVVHAAVDNYGVTYEFRAGEDGKVEYRRKGSSAWDAGLDELKMDAFSADELIAVANAMKDAAL